MNCTGAVTGLNIAPSDRKVAEQARELADERALRRREIAELNADRQMQMRRIDALERQTAEIARMAVGLYAAGVAPATQKAALELARKADGIQ